MFIPVHVALPGLWVGLIFRQYQQSNRKGRKQVESLYLSFGPGAGLRPLSCRLGNKANQITQSGKDA